MLSLYVAQELRDSYNSSTELRKKHDLEEFELQAVGQLTEDFRRSINFIITLGGDGTILWASKQFSGDYVPPLITFDQGSLGFLCNFVFNDHKLVMSHLFTQFAKSKNLETKDSELGLDKRLRLKV